MQPALASGHTGREREARVAVSQMARRLSRYRPPECMQRSSTWNAGGGRPKGGWKGRGLWSTVSTRAPFHMEGGKGTSSKVVRFQMRPNPLAK